MTDRVQHSHISRILTNPNVLRNPASFFEVYQIPVRKFFSCLCRDASEADEQFQEFALKFMSGAFDSFNSEKGRFRDYLKTVLRNQVARDYGRKKKDAIQMTEEMDAVALDPKAQEPLNEALREFDATEGEQIKHLVDRDMSFDEADGKNAYHSLLQFAVNHQNRRLEELRENPKGKTKISVSTIVDFILESTGETVTKDTAKQRMFRAKSTYASKMIMEIGSRIGDSSIPAVQSAAQEMGLSVFVENELYRRAKGES